jgi:hypothetical protein
MSDAQIGMGVLTVLVPMGLTAAVSIIWSSFSSRRKQ